MQRAFVGIRIVVVSLIASGVVQLAKKSLVDKMAVAIFVGACVIMVITNWSPVVVIVLGAVLGLLYKGREVE